MEVAERIDELDLRVAVVSFAEPATLELFARASPYPFEFYGDPEREAYAAFGFGRGSIARVRLDPRVWMASARGVGRGHVTGLPSEDTLQLGGDVLVDAEASSPGSIRQTAPTTGRTWRRSPRLANGRRTSTAAG